MKKRIILQSLIACVALGTLVLTGGCKSTNTDKEAMPCPKCSQKVRTFHPKKGVTYHKMACTSCGKAVTIDNQGDITGVTHYCDNCVALVGKCPVCKAKVEAMEKTKSM